MTLTTRMLTPETWDDFAALVEANNGVWGGCWCIGFHPEGVGHGREGNRELKRQHVTRGTVHQVLVYDGDRCVGWCQFGPAEELPRIKHQKAYRAGLTALPDWRITCFFVDKSYRGKGVANAALEGALKEIARLGGGTVESHPEDMEGRSTSASFLYNGTLAMFERQGFTRTRQLGKNHWLVAKLLPSRRSR